MNYREILYNVRETVPVKSYNAKHEIEGNIPEWLSDELPLFGSEDGDKLYLNSGGRNILIEENGRVFRIKGVDPKGVITNIVANSEKNMIADVRMMDMMTQTISYIPVGIDKNYLQVPSYTSQSSRKPFNFLTEEATEKDKITFEIMGENYDKMGFSIPIRYRARVRYPQLLWGGEPLYSLIYEIPDIESDLREGEFTTVLRKHLQHASIEQLKEIKDQLMNFYKQLVIWHAFDCRGLADNGLFPTDASFQGHNYVLGHVKDGGIGIVRVDHTSTEQDRSIKGEAAYKRVSQYIGTLIFLAPNVVLALEMTEKGVKYDTSYYSSYFDRAFKFHDIVYNEWEKTLSAILEMHNTFEKAFKEKNPQPIEEEELISLYNAMTSIPIDEEFEKRRQVTYAKFEEELNRQSVSPQLNVLTLLPLRTRKIGRNETCPCGSGKKYKKCCGR
jgi:hypothetical protein